MTAKKLIFAQLIYNIMMSLFLIVSVPYFLVKIITTKKYRSGLIQRLGFLPESTYNAFAKGQIIWVHAVSVGEAQAAFSLIKKLCAAYPDCHIILSTTTVTGQKVARMWAVDDPRVSVIYFPLDFCCIFRKIFKRYDVRMIILIETEIWPNFLMEAYRFEIPVLLVNGRISEKSFRGYKRVKSLFLHSVAAIKCFCMQDTSDAEKLYRLGVERTRVNVVGNIKYESALNIPVNKNIPGALVGKLGWNHDQPVWVVGSTHHGEDEIVCSVYQKIKNRIPDLKMILAPRHPERLQEVEKILKDSIIQYARKTDIDKEGKGVFNIDAILLDTMGELRHLYSIATVTFVGKSLVPGGGQNILEPASLGKPVVFGQYMDNFARITEKILNAEAGIMVKNEQELVDAVSSLFENKNLRDRLGGNAVREIKRWQGASDKILSIIDEFITQKEIIC